MRITAEQIKDKKKAGKKVTMLTAYDYPMAVLLDQTEIDIVLVGDSLANVILGLDSTKDITMNEMIHHAKAVNRGVKRALLVGDMPFESYQKDTTVAVANAKRFVEEAGCNAVKLEWFDQCLDVAEEIVKAGIPVMGHVGLTPQTADEMKVQGKDASSAEKIVKHAKALEEKGCFSIVLECIPLQIAEMITQQLTIPTIGIGAGRYCDGQVLVTQDMLGLFQRYQPKFVKQYIDLTQPIKQAIGRFIEE